MIELPDLSSRLAAVKKDLEVISSGQRYHFESLITRTSIMPGGYDAQATTLVGSEHKFRITATPASGTLLPVNLEVRYRVGFSDVLANPNYDTTARYIVHYRKIPTETGVHVLDVTFVSDIANTVYFKVIATGMDEYEITMDPLVI